jgi:hypothetical protein
MTAMAQYGKVILTVVAMIDLLAFSSVTTGTMLAFMVSTALVVLGIGSLYRPSAMVGFVIATIAAAISIEIDTMTVLGTMLTATFGLFFPVTILGWIALSAEQTDLPLISLRSRETAFNILYSVCVLIAVPVFATLIGVFFPSMSVSISLLMEIAIILMVATVLGIIMTSREPTTEAPRSEEAATETSQ